MPISVEQLWADKYAALHAAAEAEEAARRAEDFIDISRTVCGLELRAITPRDLLYLDYAGSPFIRGGEIKECHIPQFLWQLCEPQPRGWWAERRFYRHVGALIYDDSVAEIRRYLDRTFADAPSAGRDDGTGRPIGTSFVAPLIVRIAAGIPSLTPVAIMDTPIAQLFQFRKILALESGARVRERGGAASFLAQCLDETNRINAASPEPVEREEAAHG
jgi:hypothetical protein